jgi:tetratricopeptide (TPR) repeat protein
MAAEVEARDNNRDKALELVTEGLRFEPTSIELNRMSLGLLMQTDRWRAIDKALENLRQALSEHGAPMTEANLAAASIFDRRGQSLRALAEYQAAAGNAPNDVGLQLALARAAERAGNVVVALDTYAAILRLAPGHPEASAALARIQKDKKSLEVRAASPSHTGLDDK